MIITISHAHAHTHTYRRTHVRMHAGRYAHKCSINFQSLISWKQSLIKQILLYHFNLFWTVKSFPSHFDPVSVYTRMHIHMYMLQAFQYVTFRTSKLTYHTQCENYSCILAMRFDRYRILIGNWKQVSNGWTMTIKTTI